MTNEERDIQRKLKVLQHAKKIGMYLFFSLLRLPRAVCVIGCVRECAQNAKSAPSWSALSFVYSHLMV
jgi:hypothetical protein